MDVSIVPNALSTVVVAKIALHAAATVSTATIVPNGSGVTMINGIGMLIIMIIIHIQAVLIVLNAQRTVTNAIITQRAIGTALIK
mmetsp:Transcript_44377/g.50102  ORF Transcript_44377/g.50102 Transcript_44377/m.50102 type:complete len:85 (-) Transcript_44377:258-512(-)